MSLHWFITGSSSGLGRCLVEEVLARGDRVTATARSSNALDDLIVKYPNQLTVEKMDVTKSDDVNFVIDRVLQRGSVDVVVNNAGGGLIGAAEELTEEHARDQIALNLLAPIQITRAFLAPMREQGSGRIIQISSASGQFALPGASLYHAAKWGLEGFSESVAQEVAEFGVFVTLAEPGGIRTAFQSNLRWTTETAPYKSSAVGRMREYFVNADETTYSGDPAKMAQAIFETTRSARPPLRLPLGGDAYDTIRSTLLGRIAALEEQESLARSVRCAD